MKISSISGQMYPVRDLDRTAAFYEQLGSGSASGMTIS